MYVALFGYVALWVNGAGLMGRHIKPGISGQLLAVGYQGKAAGLSQYRDNSHIPDAFDSDDTVYSLCQSRFLFYLFPDSLLVTCQLLVNLVYELVVVLDDTLLCSLAMG